MQQRLRLASTVAAQAGSRSSSILTGKRESRLLYALQSSGPKHCLARALSCPPHGLERRPGRRPAASLGPKYPNCPLSSGWPRHRYRSRSGLLGRLTHTAVAQGTVAALRSALACAGTPLACAATKAHRSLIGFEAIDTTSPTQRLGIVTTGIVVGRIP